MAPSTTPSAWPEGARNARPQQIGYPEFSHLLDSTVLRCIVFVVRILRQSKRSRARHPPSLPSGRCLFLRLLRTDVLRQSDTAVTLPHMLVGTVDSNHNVREIAQEYAKRTFGAVGRSDMENRAVVQELLALFVGGKRTSEVENSGDARSPQDGHCAVRFWTSCCTHVLSQQ